MVTLTLPDADIRGFYRRLGIQLPERPCFEASVRCFAAPDAHRREDHDPSCSINVINGLWNCHGCGADGGPYDAALAKHHTPRSAIDLMIAKGLIERRARLRPASELLGPSGAAATTYSSHPARRRPGEGLAGRSVLQVTEHDVRRWQRALSRRPTLIAQLARGRGWRYQTMRELDLGVDRGRITIPIRDSRGDLQGLLRYQPEATTRPKMLAAPGSNLALIPHPAADRSSRVLLVEGPPDMIAARSRGLPAVAVPGDQAWQPHWAQLLAERDVTIVMDADTAGRTAAERIARDLNDHALTKIVDLAPQRTDGYDLTDWLIEHAQPVDVGQLPAAVLGRQRLASDIVDLPEEGR
jgi:hypothetical protein